MEFTQNFDPFNLGFLIAGAQRSGEGRANRKSMLSMGRQEVESCRIGKRYRRGGASAYLEMPETPGEVRRYLPFEEELTQAVETSLNGSLRSS